MHAAFRFATGSLLAIAIALITAAGATEAESQTSKAPAVGAGSSKTKKPAANEGFYTAAQASQGRQDYGVSCASCHGTKLEGGAGPTLSGSGFVRKWQQRKLSDLWQVVHNQMPLGAPGSLQEAQSLAIIAYILRTNAYPEGANVLAVASLERSIGAPGGKALPVLAAAAPPVMAPKQPSGTAPTQSELDAGDVDARHWLTYNKGYNGYRYSNLQQVNRKNAGTLRATCAFQLGEVGPFQNGPIVYDGVLYTTTGRGTYAIDASNCRKLWEHQYTPWGPEVSNNSKGAAVAGGRVIRGTQDGSLIALDAKTGELLWLRKIMDSTNGEFATAAPLVWNDMVFIGKAGGDRGIRGEMMAFDARDGSKIWGFDTIPMGTATGAETWKIPQSALRGGGATWTSYSLDLQTGLLLVPVGNPGPDFDNDVRPGTNLFTNSVVALDAKTGKLKWWHQLRAPDDRDWDTAVVSTFDRGGRKLVAAAGKDGVLHVVDGTDGKLRFMTPLTQQLNTDTPITAAGVRICPIAAIQWNGPAYSPSTGLLYINAIDWCAVAIKGPTPKYVKGQEYLGWKNGYGTRDPISMAFGLTHAIDPDSGKILWSHKSSSPTLGGLTATAGDVLLTGDTGGDFLVLDATSDAVLYRFNTGGAIGGGVITYEAKGKQYIGVASGNTSREVYQSKGSATIFVFGL